ncbi:MAG: FAD binding domain-containing protein, partial [Firmicutes bacterium]|nr:FAD binding domain-containing protein [Bacillota bacterium]
MNQYGAKGARVIAGGTDLLMAMRSKAIAPKYLIDLADLRLDYIVKEREYLGVGAMCTFNTLAENELVKQKVPVLIEAANQVGAVQTRHLATIG